MGLRPATVDLKSLASRLRGNDHMGAMPLAGAVTPAKAGPLLKPNFHVFNGRLATFMAATAEKRPSPTRGLIHVE